MSLIDDGEVRIPLACDDLQSWLRNVEEQPAFLLHGLRLPSGKIQFWMLCIHDWMVRTACRTRDGDWYSIQSIPFGDFRRVDSSGQNFHQQAIVEVDRTVRGGSGIWRSSMDPAIMPVSELTLMKFMEAAPFLEVPKNVFRRLVRAGSPDELTLEYLSSSQISGDQVIDDWLKSIRPVLRSSGEVTHERLQFKNFSRFLERRGDAALPRFQAKYVRCWRTFTVKYPESLQGYAHVIRTSNAGERVAFAAAMLPMLALSNDRIIASRAAELLNRVGGRVHDFRSYRVRRELLRAPSEGGERRWLPKATRLLATEGRHGPETRYLASYGWTPDVVEVNIENKLLHPSLRDEHLREFYEVMGDVVSQRTR
ncbi:hypothetical protein [Pseudonocardia sp.]|uniref:hypothetical protein n=1 Tax=Pseudonocardia sp. TaxID=60912 RepID=UPI0031FCA085